jgi:hypothetical protein
LVTHNFQKLEKPLVLNGSIELLDKKIDKKPSFLRLFDLYVIIFGQEFLRLYDFFQEPAFDGPQPVRKVFLGEFLLFLLIHDKVFRSFHCDLDSALYLSHDHTPMSIL